MYKESKTNSYNVYDIKIATGYTVPSSTDPYVHTLWKLQGEKITGETYLIYFWVVFVDSQTLFDDYLLLTTPITKPSGRPVDIEYKLQLGF